MKASAQPGKRVSHYEILAEVGRGGMGVVYRAKDLDLPREVALKHPWPELASEPTIRRRFQREAKAASQLLHSNIVPVLEVFEDDGCDWLVMEYVGGGSLRDRLRRDGPLLPEETLHYSEGLAEALKVAHEQGILHRDINPKNILLDSEDRARLTDFGLVRFIKPDTDGSIAATISTSLTGTGRIVGTPAYMSPEQALGRAVDRRSDLYSLGAVMYEMCTGEPVFDAHEQGELLDVILHREPKAIARLNYEVPEELERIIRKCLAKRPDERYQDASGLISDLKALRRRLKSREDGVEPTPAGHLLGAIVGLSIVLSVVLLGAWWWFFVRTPPPSVLPTGVPRQVTSVPGWAAEGALSPDGSLLAYVSNESGNSDIWIVDVRGSRSLQLTEDPGVDRSPAWLPDGSGILFESDRSGESAIWQLPQLGGSAKMIVRRGLDPSVSPDGKRIAFATPTESGDMRIAVAPVDAPDRQRILTTDEHGLWDHRDPAWSPDGESICYAAGRDLWLIDPTGNNPRPLTADGEFDYEPTWSSDGRFIYFSSYREGTLALWRIAAEDGQPQRMTMGVGPERRPSIARDGSRLAYSTFLENPDLMLVDLDTGRRQLLAGSGLAYGADIAPDSSGLVFVSDRWGEFSLWVQRLNGIKPDGVPWRLTDHPGTSSNPAYSPDGEWIAYHRVLEGQRDIWVVPSAAGRSIRITDHPASDVQPAWAPDGTRVVFVSDRSGGEHLWVKSFNDGVATGPAVQLTNGGTTDLGPAWSPDGSWLAYTGTQWDETDVYVIAADGDGSPRRITHDADAWRVDWEPSSGMLLIAASWGEGVWSIKRVDPVSLAVTDLDPPISLGPRPLIGSFDVSLDGRLLVFTHEELRGDMWVLEAEPGSF